MAKKSWGSWKEEAANNSNGLTKLENWKKNGSVTVWIHTKSGIYQKGQHFVPYILYNKEKKVDEVKFLPFNCHEDYETIKYRKDPERCPLDLFRVWLESNEDISPDDVVWECIVGNKSDVRLTKYDLTENWQRKLTPKSVSVLAVIDDANPTDIVVTEETMSIEMGIFKAIKNYETELIECGDDVDLSDPDINPYPFKWIYNAKAKKSDEYYNVIPLSRKSPSQEILDLLNSDSLDLSKYILAGDSKKLRRIMEDHVVVDGVPFDDLFANVKDKENTSFNYGYNKKSEDIEVEEEEVVSDEEEVLEEVVSEEDEKKCPDCGEEFTYDKDGNQEECECSLDEVYVCDVCDSELPPDVDECPVCKEREEKKKLEEEKKKKAAAAKKRRLKRKPKPT